MPYLEAVRALDAGLRLGFTVGEPTAEKLARAVAMQAEHVGVSGGFVTAGLVAECAAMGLAVRWTGACLAWHGSCIHPIPKDHLYLHPRTLCGQCILAWQRPDAPLPAAMDMC